MTTESDKSNLQHGDTVEYGLIAEFSGPVEVLRAAEQVRASGFQRWDVFGPYPLREVYGTMGLRDSPVGWFGFVCGLAGFVCAMATVWYLNRIVYPLPIGGKPFFSPFSAFPTAYELAILLAAFGVCGGLMWLARLPHLKHPLLKHSRFTAATRDRFFVVIESADPNYDRERTRHFLEALGATTVESVKT